MTDINLNEAIEIMKSHKVLKVAHRRWGSVDIYMDDGHVIVVGLKGDCCSCSTFEDVRQFEELNGRTIQDIELRSDKERTTRDENHADQWSFLVFITSGGHVTINWHNESNGYYSGNVTWEMK